MNHKKTGGFWLIIVFLITSGIIFLCDFPDRDAEPGEDMLILAETGSGSETVFSGSVQEIFVYVCGCVISPGVYRLDEGARVYQALEAAGGPAEDADTEGMNLAGPVNDGDRIFVPRAGAEETADLPAAGTSLININQASAEDLKALPGIGQSKANAIINYRIKNGSFSSKEDLLNVPGIKEGIYDQIEALITVK